VQKRRCPRRSSFSAFFMCGASRGRAMRRCGSAPPKMVWRGRSKAINEQCRHMRPWPLAEQHRRLCRMLQGHFLTPNAWPRCFIKHDGSGVNGYRAGRGRAMSLGRSSRGWWPCTHCHRLALSTATSDREPTSTMKNRMRELRTFGSVRGEGSDALDYSENRSTPDLHADANRSWPTPREICWLPLISELIDLRDA
jgi:hypothetical protein